MTGCGGWVRDERIPVETDPLFTGTLIFANCNFYGPKSGTFAKLDNPRATIVVDDVTLRNKWHAGLGAIQGGAPLFHNRMVLEARLRQNQTVGSDVRKVRFSEFVANGDSEHFRDCYDADAGVFTVPAGGLDQVTVTATVCLAEAPDGAPLRLAVLKNDTEVLASNSTGPSASVSFKFSKLAGGDRLAMAASAMAGRRRLLPGEGTVLFIEASRF
jgi:hypothetical protein